MSTYYLVHGAWHGGWCWYKVVAKLLAAGHTVWAPDTIGHGLDRTPPEDTTFKGMVEDHVKRLDGVDGKVILVGHSFGGMLISQIAEERPEKVAELVYVAAFLPPAGKSTLDMSGGDSESLLAAEIVLAPDRRTGWVNPAALEKCFYANCPPEDVALARMLMVVDGFEPFTVPVSITAARWGEIPRSYIECTGDKAIGITRQREMAKAQGVSRSMTLNTDHSPFFSMPEALVHCLTG
jgi:pimeloyl-ACP methyl ester carboxylesterase